VNSMFLKKNLIRLHQLLGQFGFDPIIFVRSIRALPLFFNQFRQFRRGYSGVVSLMPFLQERYAEGGVTKTEYFWQDLIVARSIFAMRPERHVDVGSSVEGFVAHVASFREIEVFDVRPITTVIPGVVFRQADLMDPNSLLNIKEVGYCDSISCLHAIEHFGLGRYGDPINPKGHEFGIANMAQLLKAGGYFYLSAPIGQERVVFNANRVFDPRTIVRCASENGLILRKFTVIATGGIVKILPLTDESFQEFAQAYYNLGIFVFEKSVEP
jgi:hypothetical protein